ncbi:sensor histidine kinase [Alkaliphilus oremlandii]|uniref:histidine kinase n=1 Tax=Alkaliphilus oremlandii (strain OhILAs) TaxID=350688 RepID=A8MFM7_ALKOO|nr:HAMP domain-containing sensor histidine kinase [Alkaliphilus oremlandii]ABW17666.1 integral membrane sensor signal transduction histidine kinase [Alkaliphilus oremlandii OhILAs]
MNSIKRRITINFIFIVVITVVILEIFLINIVKENYYRNLEQSLSNQIRISADLYSRYFSDATLNENILNNVDTFWKQTNAQVEILDKNGKVLMDSIGVIPSNPIRTDDVIGAINGEMGTWIGKVEYDNNKVMAISHPLRSGENIVGVLRFITSLREVNRDINEIAFLFIGFGALVILISSFVGIFLTKTITGPLKNVTESAEKMALGDYSIRSVKTYDDEIGKLSDTLNYMASEIVKKEELKNDFISSVSHELRTPLTSIKGWAITLKHSPDDKEILADGLNIIETESDRLANMVEELLDFSKFVSGKISLEKKEVNINEIIDHIKKQLTPRAMRDNIKFEVIAEEPMPIFCSDGNRLKQVFINVLDNAFKFTPAGGSVSLVASYRDGNFIFNIKDTGHGISAEDLPRVKEKFYKGRTSLSQNGIGLSICDEIISLMKGTFEIKSQLNKGTEIIITLPLGECE